MKTGRMLQVIVVLVLAFCVYSQKKSESSPVIFDTQRFTEKFSRVFGEKFMFTIPANVKGFKTAEALISKGDTTIYSVEGDIFNFTGSARDGYFFCGFISDPAGTPFFYYCKSSANEKIYLKLPCAGDSAGTAAAGMKLRMLKGFESAALSKVKEIRVQDAGENSFYSVTLNNDMALEGNYAPLQEDYDSMIKQINK